MGDFQGTLAFFHFLSKIFLFFHFAGVPWKFIKKFFQISKKISFSQLGLASTMDSFIEMNATQKQSRWLEVEKREEVKNRKSSRSHLISSQHLVPKLEKLAAIDLVSVVSDWTLENCMLTRTHLYICDEDNWKSLKNQPCMLLTCATRSTKRRHCMWAKIANKSLIMIDLRRTRLRKLWIRSCISSSSNLQYNKRSSARLSDVA